MKLSLTIHECYSDSVNEIFETFAKRFPTEITNHCQITPDTEHQLDNFGPGSAWLFESPYKLSLSFSDDLVELLIS